MNKRFGLGKTYFFLSIFASITYRNSRVLSIPTAASVLLNKKSFCSSSTALSMSTMADLSKVPLVPIKDGKKIEGAEGVTIEAG